MYPIDKIKNDFPILSQKVHNHDYIYFDSAATTQKPQCVIDAIVYSYTHTNSNIHRGIHTLSRLSTDMYENARTIVQQFINAPKKEEVIFTKGATESINLVASSFGEIAIHEGDEIIISAMEHHSNLVPWQILCEKKQAKLRIIPFTDDGVLDMAVYRGLLSEKTKLVSIVHVSNTLGTINPIEEIIDIAHSYDVPVLVDGSQSIQHTPINVQKIGCDFFVFSGHKVYAPNGIGVLWAKEEYLEKMPPYQSGGDMIETVTLEKTTYNVLPFKFEAGTTNYVGAYALSVALEYLSEIGVARIAQHEHELMQYALQKITDMQHIQIIGTSLVKAGALSFMVDNAHPADIGMILDKQGIAIRTGTHCTEPIMQFYNIPGTVRISFGLYNSIEEIDYFLETIKKVIPMFNA
ncbi:MAG: cysteine desulfurase [Bacteroidales bacterium]|jgi:cysteine desulfurase/selenocysteine lyase|nr:cysteine desulfurase [Bacteroidales bacterium]